MAGVFAHSRQITMTNHYLYIIAYTMHLYRNKKIGTRTNA